MAISFYESIDDTALKFAVIIARTAGKYVFCKHRERHTLECPGGHREPGETILETARRELYEETGATDFSLVPICAYCVPPENSFDGTDSFGMLYYANIRIFEAELHSEIEKIVITEELPTDWTYPDIQPFLLEEARKRGFINLSPFHS